MHCAGLSNTSPLLPAIGLYPQGLVAGPGELDGGAGRVAADQVRVPRVQAVSVPGDGDTWQCNQDDIGPDH